MCLYWCHLQVPRPQQTEYSYLCVSANRIRTQRNHIPLLVAFNTYCIVPLSLSHRDSHIRTRLVTVKSLHLFQRDGQECFIYNICVFLFIWLCIMLCVCVWVLRTCGVHLPLTHALTHPHPFTTTHKHTQRQRQKYLSLVSGACVVHGENRFHITMKPINIDTHYTYGMWMLLKTWCVSSSELWQSHQDNQQPAPSKIFTPTQKRAGNSFHSSRPLTCTHKHTSIHKYIHTFLHFIIILNFLLSSCPHTQRRLVDLLRNTLQLWLLFVFHTLVLYRNSSLHFAWKKLHMVVHLLISPLILNVHLTGQCPKLTMGL